MDSNPLYFWGSTLLKHINYLYSKIVNTYWVPEPWFLTGFFLDLFFPGVASQSGTLSFLFPVPVLLLLTQPVKTSPLKSLTPLPPVWNTLFQRFIFTACAWVFAFTFQSLAFIGLSESVFWKVPCWSLISLSCMQKMLLWGDLFL